MNKSLPIIDEDGEVRELTEEDLRKFRPASEVLPKELYEGLAALKKRSRGPQKSPIKERVTLRLSPEIVRHFRATGRGWQTRVNDVLHDWLKQNAA
jgi:uncharacterized protein (DUF4415 family)